LLRKNPDPRLRAYVVWVPQLAAQLAEVADATRRVPDPRARQFWDPSNTLGKKYGEVLGIGFPAWDVYMVFGPHAAWNSARPPAPSFWMQKLGGVTAAPMLDPQVFAREVARELDELPESGSGYARGPQ
jgi:hypothetical protein